MVNSGKPFLTGGEESGGIAIAGHIPERDGIWMGLTIWECMAKTGKSLTELIEEIYSLVGTFAFERYDLHLTEELKQAIIRKCENRAFTQFDMYKVIKRGIAERILSDEKEKWWTCKEFYYELISKNVENKFVILLSVISMVIGYLLIILI